jgi:two-component system OmpR family sensor kinase
LGLALTKTIVEEHQGSIDVRSEPRRGSAFTVKLPSADAKPVAEN